MNFKSAVRAARTATTAAQNAGRIDGYIAAENMGIKLKKQWLSTLDSRTRHSHAMLDGETIGTNETFSNGCKYPGDPNGTAEEIYNCRCTLVSVIEDAPAQNAQRRARSTATGKNYIIEDMTYTEWESGKKKTVKTGTSVFPAKSNNKAYNKIVEELQNLNVAYNPVTVSKTQKSETEIISAICGGDETTGSCASVALAYVGQKHGLDVLDYRGGSSMEYFARKSTKVEMFKVLGAEVLEESKFKTNLTNGKRALLKMEQGKEYYLSVGKHAAIVRLNENGEKQYLELQSKIASRNGWRTIDDVEKTLKRRFGCSLEISSTKIGNTAFLTDIGQFEANDELKSLLGFINTAEAEQRKGKNGREK